MTTEDSNRDADQPEQATESAALNYARPGTERPSMSLVTIATFGHSWEAHLAAGSLKPPGECEP